MHFFLVPPLAHRILIVEDHADSRELLSDFLTHHGYVTVTARHGLDALAQLEADSNPDLILLDLSMPMMDGWTLRARLLTEQRWRSIPVVVVSALDDRDPESVQGSLRKPVDLDELLETIQRLLSGPAIGR